jgi:hypothetical protein
MPYGGVYAKASAAALKDPKNAQLQTVVNTIFKGTTLRAMLLNAYAFSMIGTIMLYGAIASFVLAAIMAVLTGLGFWHASRTAPEKELLPQKQTEPIPAS